MRNGVRKRTPDSIGRARELRKESSYSETALWKRLRNHKTGFSFRRNHPMLSYWLDFYCPEAKLCVEVDGEQHELTIDRDDRRDMLLAAEGVLTLRFPSLRVLGEMDLVVLEIIEACKARTGHEPQFKVRA